MLAFANFALARDAVMPRSSSEGAKPEIETLSPAFFADHVKGLAIGSVIFSRARLTPAGRCFANAVRTRRYASEVGASPVIDKSRAESSATPVFNCARFFMLDVAPPRQASRSLAPRGRRMLSATGACGNSARAVSMSDFRACSLGTSPDRVRRAFVSVFVDHTNLDTRSTSPDRLFAVRTPQTLRTRAKARCGPRSS